jgi:hypothetical protein
VKKEDMVGVVSFLNMHLAGAAVVMFLLCGSLPSVQSFASFMMKDFCDRRLVKDEIIMNNPVGSESSDRILIVKKVVNGNEVEVKSGDTYSPKDILKVYISDLASGEEAEHIIEVNGKGVGFKKGGCGGRMTTGNGVALELGDSKFTPIAIVGGTTTEHLLICKH